MKKKLNVKDTRKTETNKNRHKKGFPRDLKYSV